MPKTDKKNLTCSAVLFIHILFLTSLFVSLCLTSSAVDISSMHGFGKGFSNLLNLTNYTFLSLSNITYTSFMLFLKNSLISHLAASFTLYLICIILIYKTANLYKENCIYGLIAVFIFSSFPGILFKVLALNVHVSETVLILLILYFYGKSNEFSSRKYSLLYLLFAWLAFNERPSFVLYLGSIVLLTSYFSLKKKNFYSLGYNLLIILKIISLSQNNSPYLLSKTGHLFLFTAAELFKLPRLILLEFLVQLQKNISLFYCLILTFCICLTFFASLKDRKKFFVFFEIFFLFIVCGYCLTLIPNVTGHFKVLPEYFEKKYFFDVFPFFAFIAIMLSNFLYTLRLYKKYIFLFLIIILPFSGYNFFSYPMSSYQLKPDYERKGKYIYENLFVDIADKITFNAKLDTHKTFAVVLETVTEDEDNSKKHTDVSYKISLPKSKTLMEHIINVYNLIGFTTYKDRTIEQEHTNNLLTAINIDSESADNILFFSQKDTLKTDRNKNKIIYGWRIKINDEVFMLHLCSSIK